MSGTFAKLDWEVRQRDTATSTAHDQKVMTRCRRRLRGGDEK